MSSSNKRISLGLALGISLGIACSTGVVHAGNIGDTYTTGGTLTATNMDNIKGAVNDNDTRINALIGNTQAGTLKTEVDKITPIINNTQTGTLKTLVDGHTTSITAINNTNATQTTDVNNLKGNLTGGACVTNNGSDEMVRVGPICVDKYRASIWDSAASGATQLTTVPGGCSLDGAGVGCAGVVAQSRASVAGGIDGDKITWSQAQRACINAGKRLMTAGEWMAAFQSGLVNGISTVNKQDYIDAVGYSGVLMNGGYIGPVADLGGPGIPAINANTAGLPYETVAGASGIFGFRCAR
jgi:hypothetical protein